MLDTPASDARFGAVMADEFGETSEGDESARMSASMV